MTQTMPAITCGRCSNKYDTERETPRPSMDSTRCPSCGEVNEPPVAETDGGTLEVAPDSDPDVITDALSAIDTANKEIHLHVHYHN